MTDPSSRLPSWNCPAGVTVQASLADLIDQLGVYDCRIRRHERGGIHGMRVTLRRIRSQLATFAPLFDAGTVEPVRAELQWVAGELGAARDSEVVRRRLTVLISGQPQEPGLASITARVEREFGATEHVALEASVAALDSDRYAQALSALKRFVSDPPWTANAFRPADDVLRQRVHQGWERLRRRVQLASQTPRGKDRDVALHDVRKAAKRLRYATEMLAPLYGRDARRMVDVVERLQADLGERQDSVLAQAVLRELGTESGVNVDEAFVLNRLYAQERAHAADAETRYAETWTQVSRKQMRQWLL